MDATFKLKINALIVSAACMLSACSTTSSYLEHAKELRQQGQTEASLAYLRTKSQEDAKAFELQNAYRAYLAQYSDSLIAQAQIARSQGDINKAEALYQKILQQDPLNERAEQGLVQMQASVQHRSMLNQAQAAIAQGNRSMALKWIDLVLGADPRNQTALKLKRDVESQEQEKTLMTQTLKTALNKPISLEFRDQNLRTIFEVISRSAEVNFIFDRDVPSDIKTTIFARNTTVDDAIRVLLSTNQLDKKLLNKNTLLIYPNNPIKQREYQEMITKAFYVTNADIKQTLNLIKIVLKTNDVYIDERLGLIIMRDTPEAVRNAERLIAAQDLPDPEVVLDVQVMEVSRSKARSLGIKWPNEIGLTALNTKGEATKVLSDFLGLNRDRIGATSLSANVKFSETTGDTRTLANPSIRVRNKEKALVNVGSKLPIAVVTSSSSNANDKTTSFNYIDVGLTLKVEPMIHANDDVSIKVSLEVSDKGNEVVANNSTAYELTTKKVETVLRLADGETQVLAGLLENKSSDADDHIPVLGNIPVLGGLFGQDKLESSTKEIVLVITPHIVRNIVPPALSEYESGTQQQVEVESMRLQDIESTQIANQSDVGKPVFPVVVAPVESVPVIEPTPVFSPPVLIGDVDANKIPAPAPNKPKTSNIGRTPQPHSSTPASSGANAVSRGSPTTTQTTYSSSSGSSSATTSSSAVSASTSPRVTPISSAPAAVNNPYSSQPAAVR